MIVPDSPAPSYIHRQKPNKATVLGPDSVVVTNAEADYGIVRRPQKLATAAVSVGQVSNIGSSRAISNACLKFGPRLQSLRPPPLAFVFRCISMSAPRPALSTYLTCSKLMTIRVAPDARRLSVIVSNPLLSCPSTRRPLSARR